MANNATDRIAVAVENLIFYINKRWRVVTIVMLMKSGGEKSRIPKRIPTPWIHVWHVSCMQLCGLMYWVAVALVNVRMYIVSNDD